MSGEMHLQSLLANLNPVLNKGEYVITVIDDINKISRDDTICEFKEIEGTTIVIERKKADALHLEYHYVAAWITLQIHSSLEAVGLTAKFSEALAQNDISCNVIAGYYHDHIFVHTNDANKAISVLQELSGNEG